MKRLILLSALFLFALNLPAFTQTTNSAGDNITATMLLNPAQGYNNNNQLTYKVFFRSNAELVLGWGKSFSSGSARLKIGKSPGKYTSKSISVSGNSISFTPSSVQLPVGRYYALITTSSENTLNAIQQDFAGNPSIDYSNEIQFIVEAGTAPSTIAPKGIITNSVPTFQWSPIPGVPGYWIILSSTPFQIVTLDNGEVSVQGADIIWNYITDGTSVQYGEISPNSPYSSEAPPLLPNKEYNYTVLNLYDLNDVSAVSAVFSGVSSFTYENAELISPPSLISPVDNKVFYGDEYINFKWDAVNGANGYNIYILNRVSSFAGNEQQIDLPIWNSFTNNTNINFPARTTLSKGNYLWYVIANDNSGAGNVSSKNKFKYDVGLSPFTLRGYNTVSGADLLSFEVKARSIQNGVSPANPFLVSNSRSYVDSLVTGTYEFTAKKDGYYDSTFVAQLSTNQNTNVSLYLRPIPAIVSGEVRDGDNALLSDVNVAFRNISTSNTINVKTGLDGSFSKFMPKGSYKVEASKEGYKTSDPVTITISNNQLVLNTVNLKKEIVSFSGKILNDEQKPVKQALVKATSGNVVRQQNTDESGNFSFTLSSGQWVLETSKTGFVSSDAKVFNFTAGDILQNQIFKLAPKANQLSGFVYRVVLSGVTTGYVPFPDVTVTAKPQSGTSVSAVTNVNGQFSLSLRSGSYTLEASKSNYTANEILSLSLGVGETLSGISFYLTPNKSSISGVVSTSDGTGLSGVKIISKAGEYTESLPNGSYQLSVAPGSKVISLSRSGYASPEPYSANISAGQNLNNINFKMIANAGVISGKVTSLQTVLSDAEVTAISGSSSASVVSDQLGNYVLNLKPGTYTLVAAKTGFQTSASKTVTIGPGQQSSNNNFDLNLNTSKIAGSIQSNNNPLAGVRIELKDKSGAKSYVLSTDVYGNYSASVEAGLQYDITVSLPGYVKKTSESTVLTSGSSYNYNFSLSPAQANISGFVYNESNEGLGDAKIQITNEDSGQIIILNSGADGSYSSGLPSGNYLINCSAPGRYSDSLNISLERGQKVSNVNFNLAGNFAVITGNVTDEFLNPLESAVVTVSSSTQTTTDITGTDGTYFITGLVGGTYSIDVVKDNYSAGSAENYLIDAGDNNVSNFTLELQIGKINGFILDTDSQPVVDATILISNPEGREFSTVTNSEGYYEFVSLPLGSYSLEIIKTGYTASQTSNIVLETSSFEQEVSINSLQALKAVIAGTIKDESGSPLQGASINLSGSIGSGSTVSGTSGEFSIDNLLEGEYNLLVKLEGYSSVDTSIIANGGNSLNLALLKHNSTISGAVKNQLGSKLSFIVNVTAISGGGEVYSSQTDDNGEFSFANVGNNTEYTLLTDIFRQGYTNDTTTFHMDAGVQNYPNVGLTVMVNNSRIYGDVGIEQVSMSLLNITTETQSTIFSGSTGEYAFEFQRNGNYTLTPKRLGYIFTPASRELSIGAKDTVSANFTVEKNSGSIIVTVADAGGEAIEGAEASILSADGTLNLSGSTGPDGTIGVENVPAGSYEVYVAKDGYTSTPLSRSVSVSVNAQASAGFTLKRNNSSISGLVRLIDNSNTQPAAEAAVQLTYQSGLSYSAVSSTDGSYSFENIPAGSVRLKATNSGNSSELISFQLGEDENKSNVNLDITAGVVAIRGRVLYDGIGVEGVTIEALSSSAFETTTNSDGEFNFINVPIKRGENDTTAFLVRINDESYPSKQASLKIPSTSRGTTINIPEFILPSGQISVLVTDGVSPVSGVNINFAEPGGEITSIYTDETGLFTSARLLSAGTYSITLSKEQYLIPDVSSTTVELSEDTSSVDVSIILPFTVNTIDSVFADTPTEIEISSNVSTSDFTGVLYYKSASASVYNEVNVNGNTDSFNAFIPALFSTEDVQYYILLTKTSNGTVYSSEEYSVTSYARGLLSSFEITPGLSSQVVRVGDSYTLQIIVRDGLNKSINENFVGSQSTGTIEWNNSNPGILEISFPDVSNPTNATMNVLSAGQANLSLQATSSGKTISKEVVMTASDIPLKAISLNSPLKKLSNKSDGIQFTYSAVDTLNRTVLLGDNLEWSVVPIESGSINEDGTFAPVDSTYIGTSIITLYDEISDLTGTAELSVFASVNKNSSFNLTDKKGMFLTIPKGAVEEPIEIAIGTAQFGPAKKHITSITNNKTYTVSDDVYNIIYTGNSLPGDSLLVPASFELPSSESLELFEGEQVIAVYDPVNKQWITISENSQLQKSVLASGFYRFGEYSILSENEPLGIRHLSVLPSPFSPVVGPVKIGYFLTTSYPPAVVTIKIYNLRGELIRTLLDNDIQHPGKLGSRSSQKEIYWDGLTDNNYMARNGRYIIQVTVKDKEDEINKLIQVVLIK